MFEGKHIHFSPTDNKPLCSYSGKICRQRRLNGYAFCIRHILEDKSAPFKQCSYVTRNNSQKCLNAIPSNQDRGYCHSHMQVVGIIPKTERKTKVQPAQKDHATEKFPVSNSVSNKKDPGAVFRFEEDSSDITDVFSYKNGLTNGSLIGKGKTTKVRDTANNAAAAAKEAKYVKPQNGISNPATTFTTKKITDKNRNVYTTIVPANCNGSSKVNLKNSSSSSSTEINSTTAQHKSSSRVVQLSIRVQTESSRGSELKSYDVEEVRQFEQLKTLKHLDKSSLSDSVCEEKSENAKLNIFPRFAAKHSGISSSWTTKSKDSCSEDRKSEIVYNPPPPPLITRSNNGIIIKTEPQAVYIHENSEIKDDKNLVGKQPSGGVLYLSGNNNNNNSSSSNANSIENRDLKNRHDFLAHVRNSFKSQYKTIKKACKVSEKCERNTKRKLANSILQCIRIDSSICAQVLLGFDLKIPSTGTGNDDEKDVGKKTEYDDYEFFDNDSPSIAEDYKNTKNSGSVSKKNCGKDLKTIENNSKVVKSKAQRRSHASGVKAKELESCSSESSGAAENDAHNGSTVSSKTKSHKANKRVEKSKPAEVTKESKFTPVMSSKKKLKRADAMLVMSDDSSASNIINETIKDVSEGISSVNSSSTVTSLENIAGGVGKKRRLEIETAKSGTELCLSLNGHSPPGICNVAPAFDMSDHITASAHIGLQGKIKVEGRSQSTTHLSQKLNQGVGNPINDVQELQDYTIHHSQLSSVTSHHRNQGLETVLNSVGSSENAGTPDGVITDASFDSTFEHSTSSQPDCDFSEDDLEHSFELQIDPEIESQASRLLEDNVLTEADFTELFPDNRMSDHKLGRNDLQELGLEFDVNDIDYSLFANIFPNFPRTSQPESISISNQF